MGISSSDLRFGPVHIGSSPGDRRWYFVCLLGPRMGPRMGVVYAAPNGIFGSGFDSFEKNSGLWFPLERSTLAMLWGAMQREIIDRILRSSPWEDRPWFSLRELRHFLDVEITTAYPSWVSAIDGHERGTAEAEEALLARTEALTNHLIEEAVRRGLVEIDGLYVLRPKPKE